MPWASPVTGWKLSTDSTVSSLSLTGSPALSCWRITLERLASLVIFFW